MENIFYNESCYKAIEILKDFIPKKIFDSHSHLLDTDFLREIKIDDRQAPFCNLEGYKKTMSDMLCSPEEIRMNIITYPDPCMKYYENGTLKQSDDFLIEQLNKDSKNVGEILIGPNDLTGDILSRLTHPAIRGFKCYHFMNKAENTWQLPVGDYLPENVWEIANDKKMCITLHMVKDKALADEENLSYIIKTAKKYPDAKLILAHAARGFAAWTAVETVEKVADIPNVYFDFAAVCEAPAIFQTIKKAGVKKCMWGSDYPISLDIGKAISVADGFYWINENDAKAMNLSKIWTVGIENLMAMRQACIMLELTKGEIEDLFYNNAMEFWGLK